MAAVPGGNPAFYVEMKKVPRARVRFLYPAEEKPLTPVVAQDAIVWPYYVVALHTGMRLGEIARIKVEDISISIRDLFVPNSKSKRSRHVPISEELAPFLDRLIAGKKPEDHALAGVIRDYVSRRFRWLCQSSSVANLKFHDLRHTFAARLLTRGVPIYKVSKILGHSSVVVTEQHYGHLSLADLKGAISCIEGVVSVPFAVDLQQASSGRGRPRTAKMQNASKNRPEVSITEGSHSGLVRRFAKRMSARAHCTVSDGATPVNCHQILPFPACHLQRICSGGWVSEQILYRR